MNKTALLTAAVIILFLMNIGIVTFLLLNRPPRPDGEGPKRIVIERLRFDNEQAGRYELLIREHHRTIRAADEEIKRIKRELYTMLASPDPLREDSLIARLGETQQRIEKAHITHFSGIREICRPDQQEEFKRLSGELAEIFSPKGRRPPR